MRPVRISGLGCTLLDFVYNAVDFKGEGFIKYSSNCPGDGGLTPGQLVFLEDLEKFAGQDFNTIISEIAGDREPDTFNVGGPAIVSIIHAAQLLGENAVFQIVASIGKDRIGQHILDILDKTPVSSSDFIIQESRTPFTNVLSDPNYSEGRGERTFINNIGAAGDICPKDLHENFFNTDILVMGGTALVPRIHDGLDEILERAGDSTFKLVNTVFDFRNEQKSPGKPWPLGRNHDSFSSIDLLVMDHEEALKISGMDSLNKAIGYFTESPLKAFIITDGTNPVTIYANPSIYGDKGYNPPISLPVFPDIFSNATSENINADTTGAGDNFVGGVIYSLAMQFAEGSGLPDLVEAAEWGIVSGGFACTYVGGTFLEKSPGEKLHAITQYYQHYKEVSGNG